MKIDWNRVADIICLISYAGLIIGIVVAVLTGCTPKPIPIAYDCPIIQLPNSPISQTKNLSTSSKPNTVVKAYVADLMAYKAWNKAVYQEIQDVNADEKLK